MQWNDRNITKMKNLALWKFFLDQLYIDKHIYDNC